MTAITTNTINANSTTPLVVTNGGSGLATATAYAVLCGGTTSTGAFQSIAGVGTSNQVFTSNGAGSLPTFQTSVRFKTVVIQVFPTSATYTPTAGMQYCIAEAVGAGGGGGGVATTDATSLAGAGGGGGGEYRKDVFSAATIGASKAVVIGAGGAAGAAGNNNGSDGTATTLGSTLLIANGGKGGFGAAANNSIQTTAGGSGGTGGTGQFGSDGQHGYGSTSSYNATVYYVTSGEGGGSFFGYGGTIPIITINISGAADVGAPGNGHGGGGSGATNTISCGTGTAGGAGTDGYMIITEYCS